jgi:hypothetical protein
MKLALDTPGTSAGYWNARKIPARERSSVDMPAMSSPSSVTVPPVTTYPSCPAMTFERVDLPEPLGPMMAWTSPLGTSRVTPLRISVPSSRVAWRFWMWRLIWVVDTE